MTNLYHLGHTDYCGQPNCWMVGRVTVILSSFCDCCGARKVCDEEIDASSFSFQLVLGDGQARAAGSSMIWHGLSALTIVVPLATSFSVSIEPFPDVPRVTFMVGW
ncbi:hypothetical protein BC937DRAFT_94630 [Endogone sp. FLAS-F59071]|nr:hypothetical protein BC937DRAFT_94630 [Endogone sp. FLAS-F59071]|eukprot:RUS13889.1 hypothetical protein BC937DRAFT_94630 [Endogone sp. FLAS-F59071]